MDQEFKSNILSFEDKAYVLIPIDEPFEMVDRKWIADYLGCGTSNLCRQPWNLPDLGIDTSRGKLYRKCDVVGWLARPLNTRKEIYKETLI